MLAKVKVTQIKIILVRKVFCYYQKTKKKQFDKTMIPTWVPYSIIIWFDLFLYDSLQHIPTSMGVNKWQLKWLITSTEWLITVLLQANKNCHNHSRNKVFLGRNSVVKAMLNKYRNHPKLISWQNQDHFRKLKVFAAVIIGLNFFVLVEGGGWSVRNFQPKNTV